MYSNQLKSYYEADASRFWSPSEGFTGRDLDVYPLLESTSGSLLEYGCGSGSLLHNLALEARFSKCIGVDLSETALSRINQAWNSMGGEDGKVTLICPQDDRLPMLVNQSFDVLISVATIEHVIDPYVVLDELYRLAKPGAKLICSVPNYAYIKHRFELLLGIQPRTGTNEPVENWRSQGWDGMHLHTFTHSSFSTLLRDCGWEPKRWTGSGTRFNSLGMGLLRKRIPGLFSGELIVSCIKN